MVVNCDKVPEIAPKSYPNKQPPRDAVIVNYITIHDARTSNVVAV